MKTINGINNIAVIKIIIGFASVLFFMTCSKDIEPSNRAGNPLKLTIDLNEKFQTISGFGGASRMWGNQFLTPGEAQKVFGTGDEELGLSIFRIRVAANPNQWTSIVEAAQEAHKHGAKVIACPWSPPARLKDNGNETGGYLLSENYMEFVNHINDFIRFMKDNQVDIYAVSIQNEPDIMVGYESCDYSSTQMVDFVGNYGHLIEGAKVSGPESFNYNAFYTNNLLNDEKAAENLDVVTGHIYGGGLGAFPLAEKQGKEIWMTEYLLNLNTGNAGSLPWTDQSEENIWDESLNMLNTVHEAMTYNWNAYVWWYIQRYYSFLGDGDEGTTKGEILKRGYAFSHFSKYIRPGYIRVGLDANKDFDFDVTAYDGEGKIVVQILNTGTSVTAGVNFEFPSVSEAHVYSSSMTLTREEKTFTQKDNSVIVTVLPKSITTIVVSK